MTVKYNKRCDGSLVPNYCCQREGIATGTSPCQTVCGAGVDATVAALVLEQLSPLPTLWNDPATPMRERKRLIRLLVTDVTLCKADEDITAHVRLPGGACHTLTVAKPLRAWEAHTTPPDTVALIDELLADHTFGET